jgi:uroporphyrinogen decarboxylase
MIKENRMNSRERVIGTLQHTEVDRVPRHLWNLAGVRLFRKEELDDVRTKFPGDLVGPPVTFGKSRYAKGDREKVGQFVDEYGSVREKLQPGVSGEVKIPVLESWDAYAGYELPWEMLTGADTSAVNPFCETDPRFTFAGTHVRPFETIQFLRGTENAMMDLAMEDERMLNLLDQVHRFNLASIRLWEPTNVDSIFFMDDWGTQISLLISPAMWRRFFKPMYREYIQMIHGFGKFALMHSDGNITDIYPDLVEIGLDGINSQLFCMDIEALSAQYGDRITFWGEIDRQQILPFGTPEDVRKAVDRVAHATVLRRGRTGVIAQCEWGNDVPKENIEAVFDQWNHY